MNKIFTKLSQGLWWASGWERHSKNTGCLDVCCSHHHNCQPWMLSGVPGIILISLHISCLGALLLHWTRNSNYQMLRSTNICLPFPTSLVGPANKTEGLGRAALECVCVSTLLLRGCPMPLFSLDSAQAFQSLGTLKITCSCRQEGHSMSAAGSRMQPLSLLGFLWHAGPR